MPALSVVIITLNEERNIGRCLESIKGVADEVVVVDSFSTDRTEAICHEHGVRFIARKWEGYSATKNFAASLAANDWILSLDADEALSDELKKSILDLKSSEELCFAEFNRLTNYCSHWVRHCGWYPDVKFRLYDRRIAAWRGDLHETLVMDPPRHVIFLKGDILHYSYYSVAEHKAQIRRFSELGARQLLQEGKRAGLTTVLVKTAAKFLKVFFVKRGFLDGATGWTIAVNSAWESWLRYSRLRTLRMETTAI